MPIREQPTIPEHAAADAKVQAKMEKAAAENRAKVEAAKTTDAGKK